MDSGARGLDELIGQMNPELDPRRFVFCSISDDRLLYVQDQAIMLFREAEGMTAVLEERDARLAGLEAVFPCRRIALQVHSALDAVGFLAAILPALAKHGISVNPVSAFFHDHLFVPADHAELAMQVLRELSGSTNGVSPL